MRVFTGPDGPYQPGLTWPEGVCGKEIGNFIVKSMYGRSVPEPEPLLCTREPDHEGDHITELTWWE